MGPIEQSLARQAYAMRQPMPERIEKAPDLCAGLELYLEALFDLDTERTDGPIPWHSVVMYSRFYRFSEDQYEALAHHVRILDPVLMKHKQKKLKERLQKEAPRSSRRKR